jgi:cob(I)alamin adenosyltransferase
MKRGLVQVYTGDGKGKTTAAAGLALRAAGRGLKVVFIQFLKHSDSGEIMLIEKSIPEIQVKRFCSQSKFIWNMNNDEREILKTETRKGFAEALNIAAEGECDILILDEILGSCRNGFVNAEEILNMIKMKSEGVELILTGRDAPSEIIEAADLVTEMKNIKHPYEAGIGSRDGIER